MHVRSLPASFCLGQDEGFRFVVDPIKDSIISNTDSVEGDQEFFASHGSRDFFKVEYGF